MLPTKEHADRVKEELRAAGVTSFGMIKFASRYLPQIIHEDEHIGAAVYGRYRANSGWLGMSEGMLVATNRRVIFVDHKPGFTNTDEITYDIVTGVKRTSGGILSALTLHTRLGDFTLRFANTRAAEMFVRFIEDYRIERKEESVLPVATTSAWQSVRNGIDPRAVTFLQAHDLALLSTADRDGSGHGAAVYYIVEPNGRLYILSKAETQKVHDIFAHSQVALTVVDPAKAQTVQLEGVAEIEPDQRVKDAVFAQITKPRTYDGQRHLPPVALLQDGAFTVIRLTPTTARFIDFSTT